MKEEEDYCEMATTTTGGSSLTYDVRLGMLIPLKQSIQTWKMDHIFYQMGLEKCEEHSMCGLAQCINCQKKKHMLRPLTDDEQRDLKLLLKGIL